MKKLMMFFIFNILILSLFAETKSKECTKYYWWWTTKSCIYEFDEPFTLTTGNYEIRSASGVYKFKIEKLTFIKYIQLKGHHKYTYTIFCLDILNKKSTLHKMESEKAILYKLE